MANLWNVFKVQYAQGHDLDDSVPLGKVLEDYAKWLEAQVQVRNQLVQDFHAWALTKSPSSYPDGSDKKLYEQVKVLGLDKED